jgi:hypothetical protein
MPISRSASQAEAKPRIRRQTVRQSPRRLPIVFWRSTCKENELEPADSGTA